MVGRFAGWFINFLALPYLVSIFNRWFQYYILHITGSYFYSSLVFNVWEVSLMLNLGNPISRSPFNIPFASCLFLKYILSPILKEGGVLSMVFCAVLKWFSSKVFLAMANVSLWASKFSILESRSPKNHYIGSNSWWRGKFGSLP